MVQGGVLNLIPDGGPIYTQHFRVICLNGETRY
jgi:hypothetical protein